MFIVHHLLTFFNFPYNILSYEKINFFISPLNGKGWTMKFHRRKPTQAEIMCILDAYEPFEVRSGGMADVYICNSNVMDPGQLVAIKVMKPGIRFNRDLVIRWLYECHAWIALGKHPNIVRAIRVHISDNQPQLVLEYIQDSLRDNLLKDSPIAPSLAIKYLIDICSGLIWASDRIPGFVHRDLKPENILISSKGVAKVTDMGLITFETRQTIGEVTHEGLPDMLSNYQVSIFQSAPGIVGTIAYMSPEQIKGAVPIDSRSDIYALGCILYEMLTGMPLYSESDPQLYLRCHLNKPSPEISKKRTDIPSELCQIVKKCLYKNREERFASINDLKHALLNILSPVDMLNINEPVGENSYDSELDKLNLVWDLIRLKALDKARECINGCEESVPKSLLFAQLELHSGNPKKTIHHIDSFYSDDLDPGTKARALDFKARALTDLGDFTTALDIQRRATKEFPNIIVLWHNLASTLEELGDFDEALMAYDRALKIAPDPTTAGAYVELAIKMGKFDLALKVVDRMISIYGDDARFLLLKAQTLTTRISNEVRNTGYISVGSLDDCKLANKYANQALRAGFFPDVCKVIINLTSDIINRLEQH
jgi:serine/threonine protein kinase